MGKTYEKFPGRIEELKRSCSLIMHSRATLYQNNQAKIAILRDNKLLVDKLTAIQLKGNKNKNKNEPYRKYLGNLRSRAAEQEKIRVENKRVLLRILDSVPSINKKEQDLDYKRKVSYMVKLQKLKNSDYMTMYYLII